MLVRKEAYGASRPEVAKTACWRLIEELQKAQILDQIKDDVCALPENVALQGPIAARAKEE